ncbi:MAG: bifunctional UDP-N-acetylglucosamine diphosphorylase/glucosamine-1-phosphate N-acetyltransferase GlmU [Pseudomonadota bacterium]
MQQEASASGTPLEVVVLAAGKGTRMRSSLPKVMHLLAGKPMLHHVLDKAQALNATAMHVVVGHQAERVEAETPYPANWVLQKEQLGTGHAMMQVAPHLEDGSLVLVLYGDVPLVSEATLARCVESAAAGKLALITAVFSDPAALGRIVRSSDGAIKAIVEYKDATAEQRCIEEINSGILAVGAAELKQMLKRITNENAQQEYYLTDIVELAVSDGLNVEGIVAERPEEVTGVNDRVQLSELERIHQLDLATELQRAGVTVADPARIDIRGRVIAGQDVFIDANVVFEGEVVLEDGASVGPHTFIRNARIQRGARVEPNSTVDGATLGPQSSVGPFARIRPGTELAEGVKIGNFVETKKARIGAGSKASHLTYLGDVTIGIDCNIGAGTVTCNYDGINKHKTEIGDDVFVGTNSTLVAPLTLGNGAFVAAGSTITNNLGDGDLGVGRGKQRNIQGWTRPDKRKQRS